MRWEANKCKFELFHICASDGCLLGMCVHVSTVYDCICFAVHKNVLIFILYVWSVCLVYSISFSTILKIVCAECVRVYVSSALIAENQQSYFHRNMCYIDEFKTTVQSFFFLLFSVLSINKVSKCVLMCALILFTVFLVWCLAQFLFDLLHLLLLLF